VCSKWHQVALSTGALWSNIIICDDDIIQDYERRLGLYRARIDRACAHPLTVTIYLDDDRLDGQRVFQDFVLPFRFKKLGIVMTYISMAYQIYRPWMLKSLRLRSSEYRNPFMNNKRGIFLCGEAPDEPEWFLKELCLPWHELRWLECSLIVPLSAWLDVLRQAQSLEQCHLAIFKGGSGPLVGISMPCLRRLTITLMDVEPDIIIPLFATPNLTAVGIRSLHGWSSATYDILKKHYKLH
jgi:hypothetical protein